MKQHLISRISEDGPMYFDDYMRACLYDPDNGFYSAGELRPGKSADFLTSPEVSPWFGTLVGSWAYDNAASPDAVLVEVGAGSGAMLAGMAPYWLEDDLAVHAVELSSAARAAIAGAMPDVAVTASIDDLPRGVDAVVVANEVLDNVPAALAEFVLGDWVELAVDAADGDLSLVRVEARPEVDAWCRGTFPDAQDGLVVTAQLAACRLVEDILQRFADTSFCVVDYGASAQELATRDLGTIVRTFRNHRSGHDWMALPGATDVTVDVNTTAIVRTAERLGARVVEMSQREFLVEQGIVGLIDDMSHMEIHHAQNGDVMAQLIARSKRVDLEAVLDPNGLGGFRVILMETGT